MDILAIAGLIIGGMIFFVLWQIACTLVDIGNVFVKQTEFMAKYYYRTFPPAD